jgi:cell division protein FtsQ
VWVLCAALLLLLGSPDLRSTALGGVESAAEFAGLGLRQVTVSGHRFMADTEVYAALDLQGARTLLTFDARAARARLEQLPWIARASIERLMPDGVDVRVTERVPFAVWRAGEQSWLIDRDGRKLQAVPADVMPRLLRVAGEGAPKEAAAVAALLLDFPHIARRVQVAERVGGRRWRLHVAGGGSIDLPAAGEADALARLTRLYESGLAGAKGIDVRVSARVLVRGLDSPATAERGPAAPAGRT